MFWCSRCQKKTEQEVCPDCGGRAERNPEPAGETKADARWSFGGSRQQQEPKWPLGPDGEPEEAAFLIQTSDSGGGGDMTESMLRAFGIPVISRYPGDGSFGRVVLGFSGYGRELYVPAGKRELARELLAAPAAEPEEPER